jgi:uncharacterized metal-binding protein (TIGR02443 family)
MNETTPSRRRFIAGAICPDCGVMDRIVIEPEGELRRCLACGFEEGRPPAPEAMTELATRVNRPAARRVETPAEAVTIVDSSPRGG